MIITTYVFPVLKQILVRSSMNPCTHPLIFAFCPVLLVSINTYKHRNTHRHTYAHMHREYCQQYHLQWLFISWLHILTPLDFLSSLRWGSVYHCLLCVSFFPSDPGTYYSAPEDVEDDEEQDDETFEKILSDIELNEQTEAEDDDTIVASEKNTSSHQPEHASPSSPVSGHKGAAVAASLTGHKAKGISLRIST